MGLPIPEPMHVSPTIKLFRWTFLMIGIYYGARRQRFLAKREVGIKEIAHKKKLIRDAKIKAERAAASDRDMAMLASLGDPAPKSVPKKK